MLCWPLPDELAGLRYNICPHILSARRSKDQLDARSCSLYCERFLQNLELEPWREV